MKNTKKAFTLVELIVVITILAVLATVAFISFSGQTKEANKSKVLSDITNLSKAIEISGKGLKDLITTDLSDGNGVAGNANGGLINNDTSTGNYKVGLVDFALLGQNGDEFKDANDKQYLLAYYGSGSFNKYQVVGQVNNAAGDNEVFLKGSYYTVTDGVDVNGLVSASGGTATGTTNGENIGTLSIYY
jgi:prepilin-type N-terminal cleavage/methylation domain-containing protein